MSQFLTYSEVDTAIQYRMAGQAPSETKRLEAVNTVLQDLYAEYDIESGRRESIFYVVPDGRPYDLTTNIADFKKAADLRYLAENKHDEEFTLREDDEFMVNIGRGVSINEYAINYKNGKLFLKVNTDEGVEAERLHSMASLTENGTWAADTSGSDAADLTTTDVVTLEQSECLQFNVDVSQSVNNYALIENSTLTAVDLSDYVNLGRAKFWIYIPSITNFTSVELRWGSSSTNYWSRAVTTQADGSSLIVGWNFIEIDWNGATETGTVVNTSIDYVAVKLNYAASYTDQNNFRIEEINFYLPIPMKLVYYTYYVAHNSYTMQEDATATSGDQLLIPRRFKSLIVSKALMILMPEALGDDAEIPLRRVYAEYKDGKKSLGLDIGTKPRTPVKKFKLRA